MNTRVACVAFVLLGVLVGCTTRAPRPDGMAIHASPPEHTVTRLVSAWERQLGSYIKQQGGGDPAVLAQTRVLHSRDIVRPARITFDALDVDAQVPSRDGWDVEGVLIGKQASGARTWYVFLVGIVARSGYRPSSIEDIRLVALSAQGGKFSWVMSPAEPTAVRRYWETFREAPAIRFPGEADDFVMTVEEDRLSVRELRSGAEWSLRRSAENLIAAGN